VKAGAPILRGDLLEYRAQSRWLVVVILLVMGVMTGRFFQLQVLGGKKYEKLAEINQVKRTRIPPRRGQILDRKGRILAKNVDLYSVSLVPHYVSDIDALMGRLRELLYLTDSRVEQVRTTYFEAIGDKKGRFKEITVKRFLNGKFCPHDGMPLEEVEGARHQWCRTCGEEFVEIPKGQNTCPFDHSKLEVSVDGHRASCEVCGRKFVIGTECPEDSTLLQEVVHHLHCPRCKKDFSDLASVLVARLHELDGVFVEEQTVRAYPFAELFAHTVGYVNEVNAEELKRHPGVYEPGDFVGRRGVERSMEEILRGKAGEEVKFRDQKGRDVMVEGGGATLANLKYEAAVPGNSVVLTLDVEIQEVLADALKGEHSAGIAVLDAQTGEVLGLYSTPPFDPNDWAGRLSADKKKEYDDNPFYPMVNKATTAYPPASSFKIVTALAALNEGIITPESRVNCPGYYDYSGHRFGCYNKYGHGELDLLPAIVASCDVYFYRLGEWLGMDRLEQYSTMLGLGHKTGVEIGEDAGLVPSREWHERHSKGGFQPGFTLSTAVGQKDIRTTPLQMALVMAQVVNGGKKLHPFLADRIEDRAGNAVRSLRKEPEGRLDIPVEYLDFLKKAMVETVRREDGTGHTAALESVIVGGKTGTAEARQVKKGVDPYVARWLAEDHAWFVAFAPAATPRVVVACVVEHGGFGGAVAGPIVSKVIYKLFSHNLVGK